MHCGQEVRGYPAVATVNGNPTLLCQPNEGMNCYELVVVHGEPLGCRVSGPLPEEPCDWGRRINPFPTHFPFLEPCDGPGTLVAAMPGGDDLFVCRVHEAQLMELRRDLGLHEPRLHAPQIECGRCPNSVQFSERLSTEAPR